MVSVKNRHPKLGRILQNYSIWARNKQTPLKDESEYNVDDLYQKLDEVLQAINNRNLEEAKKLWNLGDADMAKYALALIDFNKAVATAIEAYLKQHQNRLL